MVAEYAVGMVNWGHAKVMGKECMSYMNYMATGHIIAEARKARQLTQKQLAERIHVSDRTVSKWECGGSLR